MAVSAVRSRFAEASRACWAQVRHLPKGQKKAAFVECMRRMLSGHRYHR